MFRSITRYQSRAGEKSRSKNGNQSWNIAYEVVKLNGVKLHVSGSPPHTTKHGRLSNDPLGKKTNFIWLSKSNSENKITVRSPPNRCVSNGKEESCLSSFRVAHKNFCFQCHRRSRCFHSSSNVVSYFFWWKGNEVGRFKSKISAITIRERFSCFFFTSQFDIWAVKLNADLLIVCHAFSCVGEEFQGGATVSSASITRKIFLRNLIVNWT